MKRAMFDALMESTTDSIVFADIKGRYLDVSERKAENWGKTRREMIGLTDSDLMSKEEAAQAQEDSFYVIQTGKSIINVRRKAIRNEKVVWYSLSEHPWIDDNGKIVGTISITRNITCQIEQEQKIIAMSEQIIDMVKIVSHDLSSPLINISTIAKRIMRGSFGEINDEVFKAANEIYRRILKLRGVVLDYLHKFSNLDKGQEVEKENDIDLRKDVIDEVLEELEDCILDNNSNIDSSLGLIPYGIIICTNKDILKITYKNLITNALKYGGNGCTISFGFEDWGDRFALNVFNDGPEVPEQEVPFLFEPFVQGGNASKGEGLGIGLATIKNMICNLGGDMWHKTTWSKHPNFIFTVLK